MADKKTNPSEKAAQRRKEFAPHEGPKKQPDGDPGANSSGEGAVQERGAETPQPVQDQSTQD